MPSRCFGSNSRNHGRYVDQVIFQSILLPHVKINDTSPRRLLFYVLTNPRHGGFAISQNEPHERSADQTLKKISKVLHHRELIRALEVKDDELSRTSEKAPAQPRGNRW